jgi:GTP pyrophosphokinase
VGAGHLTARTVLESVYPSTKKRPSLYERMMPRARAKRASKADEGGVPINGLIPGMAIHYAGCCHPLPGDRIVGVVTTGKGVTIHTIDCDSLDVYSDSPERWIDVSWKVDAESPSTYTGRIDVTVLNEPGSLGNLTTVIARGEGNITNLKIVNRTAQFFDILVDVEVRDVKHLNEILAALRATPSVTAVERARG